VVFLVLIGLYAVWQAPRWITATENVIAEIPKNFFDTSQWTDFHEKTKKTIPGFFPFSLVSRTVEEIIEIQASLNRVEKLDFSAQNNEISVKNFYALFDEIEYIHARLKEIKRHLNWVPIDSLAPDQKTTFLSLTDRLLVAKKITQDLAGFRSSLRYFFRQNSRLLILLQNNNEPRSTGGFTGSLVMLDFFSDQAGEEKIRWSFYDVYALDRLVPDSAQIPAPKFFHDLSKKISLRDANFWPHFPTSAEKIRDFFDVIGEKRPDTVIAINLNTIKPIVEAVEPIEFPVWNLSLNSDNFDLGLSVLVEGKLAGRMQVKKPVEDFAHLLFRPRILRHINPEKVWSFDWKNLVHQKNLLVHSQHDLVQKLAEKWGLDGSMKMKKNVDNFLGFDFVSIGANKSEKFLWTDIQHHSAIDHKGLVKNTVRIKRIHSALPGEIEKLLESQNWPKEQRTWLSEKLLWVLGYGESRVMLRVFVPRSARLTSERNISGRITQTMSDSGNFAIFLVPLFVVPGEKLEAEFQYSTPINRGTFDWRPYFLQLWGTPGRDRKTRFMTTVSATDGGNFVAETLNIGIPQALIDTDFRAVMTWENPFKKSSP